MLENNYYISNFIKEQFPQHFNEEHSELVAFVQAYYEWLEQTNQTTRLARQLKENRDIDTTIDEYIRYFKTTFFADSRLQNTSDTRFILKHISDLYQAKGSIRSIELLLRLMFGQEVEIFLPSKRITSASESKWIRPRYVELSESPRNVGFIGKQITGSVSGAKGFVESVVTKVIAQKRITIAYLSDVQGIFKTGEFITDNGLIEEAPKVTGSLSGVTITNGGRNFVVGDTFNIISTQGRGGKAKVTSILDATGRVDFQLANGGYGYTVSNVYTKSLSSNATLTVSNITNANVDIEDFFFYETIIQPMVKVTTIGAGSNSDFDTYANGALVYGANLYPNNDVNSSNVASGYIVQTSANQYHLTVHTGNFENADFIYTGNVATNVQLDTVANATPTGSYIGTRYDAETNVYTIGMNANSSPFYADVPAAFIIGLSSNTYANITSVGRGVGADFEIGSLGEQETLTLFTDIIGEDNNTGIEELNQPYYDIRVDGSGSNIGFVDSITIDTILELDGQANAVHPQHSNGYFANGQYIFSANVFVNTIHVASGGTGYNNSDTVVFTGGNPAVTATANITTFANGTINYYRHTKGEYYQSQPTLTITTSTGSGANLIAIMGAQGAASRTNVFIDSVYAVDGGTGYSNADTLIFTGGNAAVNAAGGVTTYANGTISSLQVTTKGADYVTTPSVTVSTSTGTDANLVAILGAQLSGNGVHANVKTANATHLIVHHIANGSFVNNQIITNQHVNAFAVVNASSLASGTNYTQSDTLTITGGGANVTATAVLQNGSLTLGANGGFTQNTILIDEPGSEYDSPADVTINTSTGLGASLTVNMDYGYGFPKSGHADLTTILWDALTFANFTIGEIASLNGINPGANYNLDPVAVAYNPFVAGNNRRDIVCVVNNRNGVFKAGERITQILAKPGFLVQHNGNIVYTGNNTAITIGEGIRQEQANGLVITGTVTTSNSTHIVINNVNPATADFSDGTGTGASYLANPFYTITTNTLINSIDGGVEEFDESEIATGQYKYILPDLDANRELVHIRRLRFGQSFVGGALLTGQTSGATANVLFAYNDANTQPIGLNAQITANVITANGVADGIEVINSGYGYEPGGTLTLENANTPFIVSGTARVEQMGIGPGFWRSRESFTSDINKIHDNNYYQEYSYVVRTGISLNKYKDILTDILHVAGTKLFGEVVKTQAFESLNLDVATTREGYKNINVGGVQNLNSNNSLHTLRFVVNSNSASLVVEGASNTVSNTDVSIAADTAMARLSVGTLLKVGNSSIGEQILEVTAIANSSGDTFANNANDDAYVMTRTAAVSLKNIYTLSTDFNTDTITADTGHTKGVRISTS